VVTPQIQESLDRIATGLDNKSGQRAWRITGDYGSGKSSFALLLAHVLATGGRESALPPTLRKSLDLTKVRQNRKRLLPILITGSREPLSVAVSRSLLKALEDTFDSPPSRGGYAGASRSRLQLIETLRSALSSSKPQIADEEALTYIREANSAIIARDKADGLLSRFGQNERSLFSFLLSNEPHGLQAFIQQTPSADAFYRIHNLYDYAAASFGYRLSAQSYRNHWNHIDSLIRSFPDQNDANLAILKTVGLLNLINSPELVPTEDALILAAGFASSEDTLRAAIQWLQRIETNFRRGDI
jgi:hypothetical protein